MPATRCPRTNGPLPVGGVSVEGTTLERLKHRTNAARGGESHDRADSSTNSKLRGGAEADQYIHNDRLRGCDIGLRPGSTASRQIETTDNSQHARADGPGIGQASPSW